MKKVTLMAMSLTALLSTSAIAGNISIDDMKDGAPIKMRGTVEKVDSEREFTVSDDTGSLGVVVKSNQSVTLKKGDSVAISGTVDKGITSNTISATAVTVDKPIAKGLSDAVRSVPGVSTADANAFMIKDLPKEGAVKVTGTVSAIESEKEFTLKDESGTINVSIVSSENAVLTKGAEVTVIGKIDNGLLGKSIDAKQVLVIASATPAVKG